MIWLQKKYTTLLSYKLEGFIHTGHVYNFKCPFCGDSKKNKSKKRGYLFEKRGSLVFHCHNCGLTKSFENFLYSTDLTLYQEYKLETLKETNKDKYEEIVEIRKKVSVDPLKNLERISDLNTNHIAKIYVNSRKLPGKYHKTIYYVPKFMTFVNSIIPKKFSNDALKYDSPRLVLPFYNYKKELIGFQGRSLNPKDNVRYITIDIGDDFPLVFGLTDVNFNKRYYIVEGSFDSMFIDNCIAANNSDLAGLIRLLNQNKENAVLIYDNQPRNSEIVKQIYAAIKSGFNVVIWPEDLQSKDINDMILDGNTSSEVNALIDRYTYNGLEAEVKFIEWKKI